MVYILSESQQYQEPVSQNGVMFTLFWLAMKYIWGMGSFDGSNIIVCWVLVLRDENSFGNG